MAIASNTACAKTTTMNFVAKSANRYTDKAGVEQTSWTRIGAAFPHKSGGGFDIVLDLIPAAVNGKTRIQIFPSEPKKAS